MTSEPGFSGRTGGRVPNWIAYDRKVLGFSGYFREEVPNSALETWRVRRVAIRYYMENDTVEIVEIREANSGLPQGTLLKRHNALQDSGAPLRWPDLRVGGSVSLYRRTYFITATDAATRAFYAERGVEQPPDEALPEGPFDQRRKAQDAAAAAARARPPTRGGVPGSTSTAAPGGGPPLPHDAVDDLYMEPRGPNAVFELCPTRREVEMETRDNAVLRFLASWDNTAVTFGEVLCFSLFYHVADGTVEVREVARRNSGRDPFPLLLARGRLPKTLPPVFGRPMSPRSRAALQLQYYDWRDLKLGAKINCYGRPLLLYDCDEATRVWLRRHVPGIEEADLQPIAVDFDPNGPKRPPLAIPPHTSGFGSEEDSLRNVLHLVPRPPPRHYSDYLENWNKVLRFEARMVPLGPGRPLVGPHDSDRRFILSFHLLDRTLSIWEPRRDNSGMEDGRTFLERTKVPNPAAPGGASFGETDMQVGAVLEVFGRGFQLLDADAYTLRYEEKECARFPWADYDKVLAKLQAWLALYPDQLPERLSADLLAAGSADGSGYIAKHKLYSLLSALGSDLSPHEVITLCRQLGADRQGLLASQLLVALGLMEPPEPAPEPQHHEVAAHHQPPPPAVPFPAPALQEPAAAASAPAPPAARVAWAPHPSAPAARAPPAAPPPPDTYRGLGPAPGHPRVDPPPVPYHHQGTGGSFAPHHAWTDDRQHARDTFDRPGSATSGASGGGKSVGGSIHSGLHQPASLWQTTNTAIGGVNHAGSYRKR
ncbi:hypothetical protein HXX76_015352 [Chlamydomonas incerta]|uniref:DM10 domain-containing protein n=1 Tax=Chlamydomonas incerta TaxID=51695 RepID=A0A835VS49_CHLIN|nr:hypothetical protein HXX76_015352 [Chlamydomonas incerta]|eukprot:KAG2423386.1 hypothetical protein HXX76_015352 [Chlamydomonas incerta]